MAFPGAVPTEPTVAAIGEALFAQLDTDRDGKLTSKELAAAPAVLLGLDENQGEVITPRAPQHSRGATPGGRKGAPAPLAGLVTRVGGVAMLDLGKTRVELRGNEEGYRASALEGIIRQQYLAQFKAADKDSKGYLVEKEVKGNRVFGNLFKAMDRDGDGKLYEREVIAYL